MTNRRTRHSGRAARHRMRVGAPAPMLPPLELALPYYEVLDEEGIERIHDASMRILEEVGIDFRDDEAIAYWKETRADVDGYRVRIDRALLMELVAKAPETFTLAARNPERSVPIGGRHMVFVPTYGSPFVLDFDNRRRYSTLEDLHAFHKLAHLSASMHLAGGIICEPVDVAVPKRHLHVVYSLLKHSDKPFMGATTARERAEDTVAMARIAFGDDFVADNTVLTGVLNCNSPLVWDATMLDALKVYAAGVFEKIDVIMTPTCAAMPWSVDIPFPPEIDNQPVRPRGSAVYTGWVNACGHPAISVPGQMSDQSLPVGVQFAGKFGQDELLLRLARQIENEQSWLGRWPEIDHFCAR